MSATIKNEVLYSVTAQRGDSLRCKGWKQESLLRMLENNMEVAEKPEQLVIYGGIGKCARNWESYHAIVDSLIDLENDETLAIQSGMPVAIFKTHRLAPRVVMANTNIMKATWPVFYDLQDKNLTMFVAIHRGAVGVHRHPGRDPGHLRDARGDRRTAPWRLARRPHAVQRRDGRHGRQPDARDDDARWRCASAVDADERIIERRIERGFCDVLAPSLDEAIEMADGARAGGVPLGIGLVGNAAEVFPRRAGSAVAARHRDRDVPVPRPVLIHPGRGHPATGRPAATGRSRRVPAPRQAVDGGAPEGDDRAT